MIKNDEEIIELIRKIKDIRYQKIADKIIHQMVLEMFDEKRNIF